MRVGLLIGFEKCTDDCVEGPQGLKQKSRSSTMVVGNRACIALHTMASNGV